jgi:four helix bundle protein
MRAKNLDDVVVYQKAMTASDAVSALLERPIFCNDFNLKKQLSEASDCVGPLIAEGFGQTTDRHLATYLGRARGSSLEMQAHLRKALRKKFISKSELTDFTLRYVEIVKMLTSWMKYLRDSDWDNRG